tara:strand:- start:238 stop:594 length:357 start_codon:yes stop_codon:yes gene_type:complete
MGPDGPSHWDRHDGGHFEVEDKIDLPLTQCTFYSGNPHIAKISKCRNFYKPLHLQHWEDKTKGTSHLEKELQHIALRDVEVLGRKATHQRWGCFVYGIWGDVNHIPPVKHLGDWCRKQ